MSRCPEDHALVGAIELARQGLPCFPCREDKRPATPNGFKQASCDIGQVHNLWRDHRGPLIGVPTGEPSGLAVIDVDQRNGGAAWFAEERSKLPSTRVHRTRSGGLHIILQHAPGLRCSAGKIAPGVDVRASGGYVIWWPAAGLSVLSSVTPAPWPDCLTPQRHEHVRKVCLPVRLPDSILLAGLIRTVATAPVGQRNSITYWAACRAGEMVVSAALDAGAAADIIIEAATRAGLPFLEAKQTAWSGIRATGGQRNA